MTPQINEQISGSLHEYPPAPGRRRTPFPKPQNSGSSREQINTREGNPIAEEVKRMASSAALRDLQRDLENKANDLSKLQKGIIFSSLILLPFVFLLKETVSFIY